MTNEPDDIAQLVEESSLGTPGARSLRRRTPRDQAAAVVRAAAEPRKSRNVPMEILEKAMAGDQPAVEHILGMIRPLVLRYCVARLGDQEIAEDAAQEVCLAVLSRLPSYRIDRQPFLAFIYGVAARHVAGMQQQKNDSEQIGPNQDLSDVNAIDPAVRWESTHGITAELAAALARLSASEREVVVLRVVVGLTVDEVVSATQRTPGAVRALQHRALSRLRKFATAEALEALNGTASV